MKDLLTAAVQRLSNSGAVRPAGTLWLPVLLLGLLLIGAEKASAAQAGLQSNDPVYIYLFWGEGCPHCAKAKPFLESLAARDRRIVLRAYEIYYTPANHDVFEALCRAAGFEPQYVPTIIIGTRHWEGYSDQIAQEIRAFVDSCLFSGCPDAGAGIISPLPTVRPTAAPTVESPPGESVPDSSAEIIRVPLVGKVDLSAQSLTASTVLIALVDGFNPCSLWVLTMLLALTLHTGSRRKVLVIGLIFLTVTAAVYALFITGLFTMFAILSFTGWVQAAVALVALFFGLVNLKDYFWYKEGLSFTISDSDKPGIFQRMRNLMDPDRSFWSLAGGTIVLAGGVSLVEFSCTAGFPVLWTNLLVSQRAGAAVFIPLLLVYLFIYQVDELAIFGAAVYSLRASRLEEKHGRILKLAGGVLMLTLAAVMLIHPSWMNNLASSLLIFGTALLAVLVILFVHRTVLPRMGIRVGSEYSRRRKRR
jgi:thiol-disulfide isomerase/thioredoxin